MTPDPLANSGESLEGSAERFHWFRWAFLSTALIILVLGVRGGLLWSSFWHGFENVVFTLVITLIIPIVLFILVSLWNLLCHRVFRYEKHPKLVRSAILLPAFGLLIFIFATLPSSPERFEQITGVSFPPRYTDATFHHSGGLLTDHFHTFAFSTTPEETERLIRELQLQPAFPPQDFAPVRSDYPNASHYNRAEPERNWFYNLATDETRTKVWISLSGI